VLSKAPLIIALLKSLSKKSSNLYHSSGSNLSDILYFRDLSKIKPIFNGIENLFREATDTEVGEFLNKDFICLSENYSVESVKTMNRKRIVSAGQ
jgi:hypothetical protein